MKKKIAIIGAGFSGLATAWNLLDKYEVTVFSDGREASKISAGLLHKYVGLRSVLNPYAKEAEKETHKLLEVASHALGVSVILAKGMLRIPQTDRQKEDFQRCAFLNEDVEWITTQDFSPGIFIHTALTVDSNLYLEGLCLACKQKGLKVENRHIAALNELKNFDFIVLATGAYSFSFHELKVFPIKGQLLELEWPSIPPLPFALNSQVYITMTKDQKRCAIGATHEHHFSSENPDHLIFEELLPKAHALYPPLKEAKVVNTKAALRCTTHNRLPFAGHIKDNIFAITGMGSRGLLYHAFFAQKIREAIV